MFFFLYRVFAEGTFGLGPVAQVVNGVDVELEVGRVLEGALADRTVDLFNLEVTAGRGAFVFDLFAPPAKGHPASAAAAVAAVGEADVGGELGREDPLPAHAAPFPLFIFQMCGCVRFRGLGAQAFLELENLADILVASFAHGKPRR